MIGRLLFPVGTREGWGFTAMPQSGPLMAIHACLPCRPGTYPSLRRWDLSSQELRSTPLPGWHIDRCNGGNGIDTAVNCGECRSELWPWRHRAMSPESGLEPTTPSYSYGQRNALWCSRDVRADIRASSPSFRQFNMAACLSAHREPAWELRLAAPRSSAGRHMAVSRT
jgi:hypothetical protein